MLWFAYYNFCRVHKSLRVTPAMEAGIAASSLVDPRTAINVGLLELLNQPLKRFVGTSVNANQIRAVELALQGLKTRATTTDHRLRTHGPTLTGLLFEKPILFKQSKTNLQVALAEI